MNDNARTMLEALRASPNENTRGHAIDILEARKIPWAPEGVTAEMLALEGRLGDFLSAVMTGDYLLAYGAADIQNQQALRSILGPDNDRW